MFVRPEMLVECSRAEEVHVAVIATEATRILCLLPDLPCGGDGTAWMCLVPSVLEDSIAGTEGIRVLSLAIFSILRGISP
jgi:hypothetical protein